MVESRRFTIELSKQLFSTPPPHLLDTVSCLLPHLTCNRLAVAQVPDFPEDLADWFEREPSNRIFSGRDISENSAALVDHNAQALKGSDIEFLRRIRCIRIRPSCRYRRNRIGPQAP
jgi:hypothetical protein